jgi:hypothetical protein
MERRRRLSLREPSQLDRDAVAVNLASWGEEALERGFRKGDADRFQLALLTMCKEEGPAEEHRACMRPTRSARG